MLILVCLSALGLTRGLFVCVSDAADLVCMCVLCVVVCQMQWPDLRSMQVATVAAFTHSITIYGQQSTAQITVRPQACFT